MAKITPDLDAAIVPNEGLGGFLLRTKLIDIQETVSMLELLKTGTSRLINSFEARYNLGSGEVSICVDVRNGKVFKIIARNGYRGLLSGKVGVGMTVSEAMELIPELYYDDLDEGIYQNGQPGVSLDVPQVVDTPELQPHEPIVAISVFAAEAFPGSGLPDVW